MGGVDRGVRKPFAPRKLLHRISAWLAKAIEGAKSKACSEKLEALSIESQVGHKSKERCSMGA